MVLFLPHFPFAVFPSSFPKTNFTQIFIFISFYILNINQFSTKMRGLQFKASHGVNLHPTSKCHFLRTFNF